MKSILLKDNENEQVEIINRDPNEISNVKEPSFVVKNYDETGKLIEDLSKIVLPLDLSQSVATIIWGSY